MRQPMDVASHSADIQGSASGNVAEAGFNDAVGGEGQAVVHGGAVGTGENHMGGLTGADGEVSATAGTAKVFGAHDANTSTGELGERAVVGSGYSDPRSEAGRAELLSGRAGGDVQARADVVQSDRANVEGAIGDPTGTASGAAEGAASGELTARTGGAPADGVAHAKVIKDDVRNPERAVEQLGETEIDKQKFEAQGAVGISVGSDEIRNKPGDDKK